MKNIHYLFALPLFLFTSSLMCMDKDKSLKPYIPPILRDVVPYIANNLNLAAVSYLLRTCKTYNNIYIGLPESWSHHLCDITKDDVNKVQFGMNKFLQNNPNFCKTLSPDEHLNSLIHCAQTNNAIMMQHLIEHESDPNLAERTSILQFFQYDFDDIANVTSNIQAYQATPKTDTYFATCPPLIL